MGVRGHLALSVVGAFLAGCASGTVRDLNVRDWVGHNASELTSSWGKPHHDYSMADGDRMIGYQFTNESVRWWPKGQIIADVKKCMVNFETDRSGKIVDATATGVNCRIGQHDQMHPKTN